MSGVQTYSVRSGASANAAASMGALATIAVAGGVAIAAGAAVLAVMATANAAKAYMERKERERQAILDREAAIQFNKILPCFAPIATKSQNCS
jgi:hypothetical protein